MEPTGVASGDQQTLEFTDHYGDDPDPNCGDDAPLLSHRWSQCGSEDSAILTA